MSWESKSEILERVFEAMFMARGEKEAKRRSMSETLFRMTKTVSVRLIRPD